MERFTEFGLVGALGRVDLELDDTGRNVNVFEQQPVFVAAMLRMLPFPCCSLFDRGPITCSRPCGLVIFSDAMSIT